MKSFLTIAPLFLCLAFCGKVQAQTTTGNDLQGKCKDLMDTKSTGNIFGSGFCAGFLTAAIEDEAAWQASDAVKKQTHFLSFCIPDNGTNGQYLQVFVKYLDEHPEELNKSAIVLLREAFNKAFPCGN